jgi:hypothetical protein
MNASDFADMMQVPCRVCVASKTNSGKTTLISELIQHLLDKKKIYLPFVFSNTYHLNGDWGFLPPHLKSGFSTAKLQQIMDR